MTVHIEKSGAVFSVLIDRAEVKNAVDGPTAAALRTLAATVDARFLTSAGGAPAPAARRLLRRRAG